MRANYSSRAEFVIILLQNKSKIDNICDTEASFCLICNIWLNFDRRKCPSSSCGCVHLRRQKQLLSCVSSGCVNQHGLVEGIGKIVIVSSAVTVTLIRNKSLVVSLAGGGTKTLKLQDRKSWNNLLTIYSALHV